MSFLDGVVNAARTVFGIEAPERAPEQRAEPAVQRRGAQSASATRTGWDPAMLLGGAAPSRRAGTSAMAGSGTLSERLRAAAAATASGAGPASSRDAATSLPAAQGAATARAATARARVIDGASGAALGTVAELAGSGEAATAARHVQQGLDYFARSFGRDGVDGAGAGVDVIVGDRSRDASGTERFAGNGGYYATDHGNGRVTEAIHFGTGTTYRAARGQVDQRAMQHADDLAIHELVHGVIRAETGHLGGEADEAGATNEAVADVLAAAATRDWRIGEGMFTAASDYRAMRNIAQPHDPSAIHGLWTSMAEVEQHRSADGQVEEHWASGVVSTAAQRTQQRIGGERGWAVVERVFYDAVDNGRLGDMSFASVAAGLRASAAATFGIGSEAAVVLDEELRRAGL